MPLFPRAAAVCFLSAASFGAMGAEERIHDNPSFTPEYFGQIGQMHNKAFDTLGKMYSSQRPKTKAIMMNDIHGIVSSFCEEGDETCRFIIKNEILHKRLEEEDNQSYLTSQKSINDYPSDFDPKLLQSINDMYSTLGLLVPKDENHGHEVDYLDNVDSVLDRLTNIQKDMEKTFMDVESPSNSKQQQQQKLHLMAALSGISVAIESTELWTNVYNDTRHPLHGLHHSSYYPPYMGDDDMPHPHHLRGRRRTQDNDKYVAIQRRFTRTEVDPWNYYYHWPGGGGFFDNDVLNDYDFSNFEIPGNIFEGSTCFDFAGIFSGNDDTGNNTGNNNTDDEDDEGIACVEFLNDRFDPQGTISADISGAIFGLLDTLANDPVLILDPFTMLLLTLLKSISASAKWALDPPSSSLTKVSSPDPSSVSFSTPTPAPSSVSFPTPTPAPSPTRVRSLLASVIYSRSFLFPFYFIGLFVVVMA